MKVEDYRGHEIFLDGGMFEAMKDGEKVFEQEKLSDLKRLIDTAEKKTQRRPAIFKTGYGDSPYVEGEVTSIVVEKSRYGGNSYDAWCSWKEEGRSAL